MENEEFETADLSGNLMGGVARQRAAVSQATLERLSSMSGSTYHPDPRFETPEDMAEADQLKKDRAKPTSEKIGDDIVGGLKEAGTQVIGGISDGEQAIAGAISSFDHWASDKLGLGGLQIFDPESGDFDPKALSAAEFSEQGPGATGIADTPDAKTVTGGLIRGVSQFLTGFAAGGKVIDAGKAATKLGFAAANAGKAAIADFVAFDGHEERLSDLIQSSPQLANPINEFLASDEDDNELVGRLKNVLEGTLTDVAIGGLTTALRGIKAARKLKAETGQPDYEKASEALAKDPSIGDEFTPEKSGVLDVPDTPAVKMVETGVPADIEAKALSSKGLSRVPLGDREVDINWGRISSADDVKDVIADMADAMKPEIQKAQRGERSNKTTIKAAGNEDAWKLIQERRTGEPLNAEQTLAVRGLWAASADRLAKLADEAATSPSPENLFVFRRAMAQHSAIQREAMAVRTETARALQQWSIPVGGNTSAQRIINDAIEQHGGLDVGTEMARKIAQMAKDGEHAAIDAFSRKGAAASVLDAIYEYWINSILSGPTTHFANMISNTTVALLAVPERALAATIGGALDSADRVAMNEATDMLAGMTGSLRDAFRLSAKSFRTGESGYGLGKIEGPRTRSISTEQLANTKNKTFNQVMNAPVISHAIDFMGSVISLPGRALVAEDEFFKTIAYRMETQTHAAKNARELLQSGQITQKEYGKTVQDFIENPPESVALQARDFAAYQTFTNQGGDIVKAFEKVRSLPGGRYVLAFLRTPANIFRFATERSPAAPLLGQFRSDIQKGGRARDMALSKMAIGTGTMWTTYSFALDGFITGSGPSNYTEKAALRRTGWMPYSVKVGDTYFAFNRLDPVGALMGIAGDMAEFSNNSEDDPNPQFDEMVSGVIAAVGQNMMNKSYFQGVSDLIGALNDPDRHAASYFERLAGSFVPSAVRTATRAQDPTLRATHDTLSNMKSRIPGLAQTLPARHDLWGREISFKSSMGPTFDAASPVYASDYDPEPIDLALQEIDYYPGNPSKTITFNGEKIKLRNRPDVFQRYLVLQGATPASELSRKMKKNGEPNVWSKSLDSFGDMSLRESLNAIVTGAHELSEDYDAGDADRKRKIIERAFEHFREGSRPKLFEEFPDLFE